ncbi:hypothetical protein QQX98_012365 [Neonectria punicea]|uniref:Uncharacterized protein n=1 Tax=Neonectria punicea TaxID=979145 RepID=A0ABR1GJ15_9HYPO
MTGTAALGVAELVGVAAAIEVVSGLVGAVSGGAAITAAGTTAAVAGTGAATGAGVATAATAIAATAGGVAFAPVAAVGVLLGAGYALISQGGDIAAQPGVQAATSSPTTKSRSQPDETAADSSQTAIPSPPGPSRGPEDDGNEPSDDDSDQHHPRLKKPIFIPKSLLEDLLKTHGRAIHRKLKRLTRDYQGTIWKNQDFRIDAGSTLHGRPNFKTWNLQVNRHPMSDAAKALKSKFGTHKKLLWGAFDVDKAPKYATWVEHILELFNQ